MELTLSNIILIIAAAQASLLSLLIFQKHQNLFANRFLALLMGSYTIILIHLLLQDSGYYKYVPQFFIVVGIPLAAFPFHYLYTKFLINRTVTLTKNDWLHFLPFVCFELVLLAGVLSGTLDFSAIAQSEPTETSLLFRLFNVAIIVQGSTYMGISYRLIISYNKHIKDVLSSIEHVQLHWLRNITIAGISALLLFFAESILLAYGLNVSNFVLSSIVFAVYVYGMGYVGLLKTEIFASPNVEREMDEVVTIESSGKYERSGLSEETAQQYLQQLLQLMDEQKPYLNSELTLSQLAASAGISPHNLSEIINSLRGQNFYDFINGYRIEQIKKDLADPSKQHLKILSIAFDAGFNSKATFNTLFKEKTAKTPSEYRRSLL